MSAETFLGLWITAGAAASRAFDPDGVPIWGRHPEHGWHHASASACALAEEAAVHGFDLPAFDTWLSPGLAKTEALRHRAAALECVRAKALDRVRLLRHLEAMLGHWRVQTLLPLASTGRAAQVQRQAAGFGSAEQRQAERRPEWDRWQRRADELRASNPRRSKSDICRQVGSEFGVSGRAVSARVK